MDWAIVIIMAIIVIISDSSCARMYKRITGEELIMSPIPFRETYLYIKLILKIKKENENGSGNDDSSN